MKAAQAQFRSMHEDRRVADGAALVDGHASCLDLPETPGGVLVQQARNQGLVRQALRERPLPDRLQVLAR